MNDGPASLTICDIKPAKRSARTGKGGDITARVAATPRAVPPPSPAPEPEPAPVAPSVAAPPLRAAEPPPRAEEILVYWERLRRGRPLPLLAELDRAMVANAWPDSMIVMFEQDGMPRIARLGATDGAIEYTPMVTDWILTRARLAGRRGTKLDEVQSFPLDAETAHYRLLMMPFGAGESVLCHLCRAAW